MFEPLCCILQFDNQHQGIQNTGNEMGKQCLYFGIVPRKNSPAVAVHNGLMKASIPNHFVTIAHDIKRGLVSDDNVHLNHTKYKILVGKIKLLTLFLR